MKRLFRSTPYFLVCIPLLAGAEIGSAQLISENLPTPAELPTRTALPPTAPSTALRREPEMVIATIKPIAGKVDIRVSNNIGTQVVFEAAGYTFPNALRGGQSMTVHSLPTPVTLKISRADGGLMKIYPVRTTQPGVLEVRIDEASPLSDDSGTMHIEPNGKVVMDQ